ncbi:hypothetical protein BO71DRAFT_395237 [Aspergillus ellipticus CBS 707.79]|uniref:Tyrosine specific protein phosphatases domain-containing protein n=1 Tax=Aspergillus ellipticus CBS 707.79 TaxID=1448320 RepID=A0A319DLI0_9EURO|nr:hypothetical protein BO71DRAFT_395237 [Aspergillus ellipticus CBS 707.79]
MSSCYELFPSRDLLFPIQGRLPDLFDIDGLSNFRDVGGYRAIGGGFVRKGLIFRSSNTEAITQTGAIKLAKGYGIRTIFDLRSVGEDVQRNRRLAIIPTVQVPALSNLDDDKIVTYLHGLATDDAPSVTAELYLWICAMSTAAFRTVFTYLRDNPGHPVLLHCELGKDRTGICIAVILLVLGVPDQEVIRDYQFSQEGIKPIIPERRQKLLQLPALLRSSIPSMAIDKHFLASPDTMRRFLMCFRKTYGSGEDYLLSIGFNVDDCNSIRRNLIEYPFR